MLVLSLEIGNSHGTLFSRRGHRVHNINHINKSAPLVEQYDLILLPGGDDVDPSLYGAVRSEETVWVSREQDDLVFRVLLAATSAKVPVVGICKGAQQLCVYSGGTLHQHVIGHEGPHDIVIEETGEVMYTRGNHHQMMNLRGSARNNVVLAYASGVKSGYLMDPEVVWFPDLGALGFQYHPEWMDERARGVEYFYETIKSKLKVEA